MQMLFAEKIILVSWFKKDGKKDETLLKIDVQCPQEEGNSKRGCFWHVK